MSLVNFWQALRPSARMGFLSGLVVILGLVAVGVYWVLSSDYDAVVRSSSPEKIAAAVREVERLKIPYRVTDDGTAVEVPREHLGRIRVGLADGGGVASGVGFELFNNTDFSTTEFTQKINYQRALQGELARTVSAIDGVASARVHLVLPDSGFLRRHAVKPTAAVTVLMEEGAQLSAHQVQGIQRLVAASVPDIKLDDIAVIDHEGIALTRNKTGTDATSPTQGRLEFKREVDAYLEGKLKRMLASIDPQGEFSVSVDATLNLDDVKVTTEDVIPAEVPSAGKATGVLVRERQTQRQDGVVPDSVTGAASGPQSASTTKEVEYKVGHRVEQVVTAPGGIERVSVAVLARASNGEADLQNIRYLVSHAIGANEERGDSVAVVILPALPSSGALGAVVPGPQAPHADTGRFLPAQPEAGARASQSVVKILAWVAGLMVLAVLAGIAVRRGRTQAAERSADALSPDEVEAVVAKVNHWLAEGGRPHGAA